MDQTDRQDFIYHREGGKAEESAERYWRAETYNLNRTRMTGSNGFTGFFCLQIALIIVAIGFSPAVWGE